MKLFKTPFMRLYKEGLSRIKVLAIVCASLTFFAAVVSPITELVAALRENVQVQEVEMLGIEQLTHPLLIVMLFSPFFVFASFSFLRRRNACDFYHALPYRRKTVYIAFALAAFTWVMAIAVICMFARAIAYALNPAVIFGFDKILLGTAVYLIACLFLMGAAAVAVTLTGTALTCLFTYAMLLVSVRVVFFAYSSAFSALVPLVNVNFGVYAFLSPSNFLPLSLLWSLLWGETVSVFTNAPLLLYFFILGVAAFVLAGVFFVRRRSEAAGFGAANEIAQHVFRFMFATPVLLCAVALMYMKFDSIIYLLLATSVAVYFLFELVFCGKSRRLLSALKFAPLMFVFAVLFAGVIQLNVQIALNRELKADDIVSIVFDETVNSRSYEDYATREVLFEDGTIISRVAEAHAATAEIIKGGSYQQKKHQYGYKLVDVAVKTKWRTRHYSLLLSPSDAQQLETMKLNHKSYLDAYVKLPSEEEIAFIYGQTSVVLTQQETLTLWQTFASEFQNLPFEMKEAVKRNNSDAVFTFTVNGTYAGETFVSHYAVVPTMVETISVLQAYLEQQPAKENLLSCLALPEMAEAVYSLKFVFGEGNRNVQDISLYLKNGNAQDALKIQALLLLNNALVFDRPFDELQPYVVIDMDVYGPGEIKSGMLIYNVSPDVIEQISKLLDL